VYIQFIEVKILVLGGDSMKKALLLSSLAFVLFGCSNQTNEETGNNDSTSTTSVGQTTNSDDTSSYQTTVQQFTEITADEIMGKINNGDAFYLLVGEEDSADAETFAPKLVDATSIFEGASSDVEGEIYYLNLTDASDQATTDFAEEYGIETVPEFHFFEGQIYHSELENLNSEEITVEEIQEFMNYPYNDEDVTTAPDVSSDN
jgi:hypothetical protein